MPRQLIGWSMAGSRLIIDVSTLIRSEGQATGISRVSYELSHWALKHRQDARLAAIDWVYDYGTFRILNPASAAGLLQKKVVIDTFLVPDRWRADKIRIREYLPIPLRYCIMCVQHPRRAVVLQLERWRHRAGAGPLAERITRIQEWFLTDKYRRELSIKDGQRAQLVSYRIALQKFEPRPGDVLLLTGADWGATSPQLFEVIKSKHGGRVVWLCYDIIALLYPHFFLPSVGRDFREYAHRLLAIADLVLVSARAVETDLIKYCREQDLPVPLTRVIGYGSDLTRSFTEPAFELGHGLAPGRYAMFVSTIEPRKGHRTLLSVWKRLLSEGVPQAAQFGLVFVGRAGWLVDDLMIDLKALNGAKNRFHLLTGIGDEELASLYRHAAFCLYPSIYEGYGLPVVEAFGYGKAVLASNGGALKEVVGDFSPTIDPLDEDAWYVALKRWIEHPGERAPFEKTIRERYRHPTWNEAAREFFATIDDALGR